jgi:hypothetical protein
MKTKFSIGYMLFSKGWECLQEYEDYYKHKGWEINEKEEDVYVIIDREINLSEGDIVDVCDFQLEVTFKITNITKGYILYELEEQSVKGASNE